MSRWVLRPAEHGDVEAITALCIQTAPFEGTGEPGEAGFYDKLFSESLGNEESLLLVAESGSEIAGFAYAVIEHTSDDCAPAPYASLDMVGVRQSYRGQGIARVLMEKAQSWAKQRGMKVIQLAVGESHTPAIKLYTSLGYRTVMRKMQKRL
jgi:ribosomal protein S18 acetylase RimI-like enzyme